MSCDLNASLANAAVENDWLVFDRSAIQGMGAMARRFIPAGTRVIEYVGRKIDKAESRRLCEAENEFIFTLDQEHDLDGSVAWNPARYINHSCAPNCEAELQDGRIWIIALRDVAPGEEVTFNYGYDLVDYKEHPCRCGAPGCVGFMVAQEFFDHVRRQAQVAASTLLPIDPPRGRGARCAR